MTLAIILITYNCAQYINEALNGILNQTYEPNEVIIADDCSTDRTRYLIKEYIDSHNLSNKWNIIFNEHNLGITGNLRNAIKYATSDVLIIMAGDDISLPNRCSHAINMFHLHPNLLSIAGSVYIINSDGSPKGRIKYNNTIRQEIIPVIKNGTPNVSPVSIAIKRTIFDIFGPLSTDVPNEDDQILFWGLISGGIFCSDETIVKYRVHPASASAWLRNRQDDKNFYTRFIEDMPTRKRNIELWGEAIKKVKRDDTNLLEKLIHSKSEVYDYLGHIENYSIGQRVHFLVRHWPVIGTREKYYILFGKFGILSWRWVKILLKKQ